MLPHFKNLHDWGRNIYVVCTNDIQRIDFAARRAGRFDFICPVGPPSIAEAEEMLKSWMPPGLRAATLAKATRGRATFHELREWARVTADEKHDEAAALLNWSTHFQPRLTISDALWEKYQRDCAEYTYP
jgi:SpoVK/Ycf46/Vps4 family AAA+-type ATPase